MLLMLTWRAVFWYVILTLSRRGRGGCFFGPLA